MLIVEGPDGAGKSTLVKVLSKELGLPVEPRACTSEGGPIDNLADWVEFDTVQRLRVTRPSLHDRHPLISEMVYGPICRGRLNERFDDPHWYGKWVDRISRLAILVWCMPSLEAVRLNVRSGHKHMSGVEVNIDRIYGGYLGMRAIWPKLVIRHPDECQVTWNYEMDHLDWLVSQVRKLEVGL